MSKWDIETDISNDKADFLVDVFKYAMDKGTDTVGCELTLDDGQRIMAIIKFVEPEGEQDE